jgi:nucleotide-binding universal stress UspA family protein
MYDRILVPVDGSKFSEEMLPHAAGIAAKRGVPLTILRVVDKEGARADAEADLRPIAEARGAQALCIVASGDVADAIVEEARRVPGTLLAMTSHGRSGLMEAMLGSVALRIVRSGETVLVYRPSGSGHDRKPIEVRQVLLALDGTKESEAIAPQAAGLAKWLDAELTVMGVIHPSAQKEAGITPGDVMESSYVRSRAEAYEAQHGVRISWDVLYGDPVEAITEFIKGRQDVVLAMTTHGRPPMEAAFLGSVTAGCLRKSGVPILVRTP